MFRYLFSKFEYIFTMLGVGMSLLRRLSSLCDNLSKILLTILRNNSTIALERLRISGNIYCVLHKDKLIGK